MVELELEKVESPSLGLGSEVDIFFLNLCRRYEAGEIPDPEGPDLLEEIDGRQLAAVSGILLGSIMVGHVTANFVKLACPSSRKTRGDTTLWDLASELEDEVSEGGPPTEPEISAAAAELGISPLSAAVSLGWNASCVSALLRRRKEKPKAAPVAGLFERLIQLASHDEAPLEKWLRSYLRSQENRGPGGGRREEEGGEELPPPKEKLAALDPQPAAPAAPQPAPQPVDPRPALLAELEAVRADLAMATRPSVRSALEAEISALEEQLAALDPQPAPQPVDSRPAPVGEVVIHPKKGQEVELTLDLMEAAKAACDPKRSQGVKGAFTRALNQLVAGLITEEAFIGRLFKEGWEPPAPRK